MKIKYILFTVIVICAGILKAQSFTASVSQNPVTVGEPFELTLTFSGADVNGLSSFQPPALNSFIVLSGPNQSTSMQIINGAVSGSRSFTYYLQAKEKGRFTIGSAAVVNKGQTLKSQPITIEAVQGSSKPKQQQQGGTETAQAGAEIGDNVFIRAFADKSAAYIGEQITITYKLYTRMRISAPQVSKLPSYQGFWSEEIAMPQTLTATQEVLNGKKFSVYTIKKAALFPSQSGDLSVTPFKLKIPVMVEKRRKSNNPFDDFFNDPFFNQTQTVEHEAVSNTLKIKALPLPEADKPAVFDGAVGSYTMTAQLDKTKGKQNEPVSLKISISGTGNISLISPPDLKLPSTIEKYEPKVNDDINRGGIISGKKTFEFLLVPRAEGKLDIPPIEFSFFNPSRKAYQTLTSQPFNLQVEKGDAAFAGGQGGLTKESVKLLGEDIHYIKTKPDAVQPAGYSLAQNAFAWVLFALPFAAVIGLAGWRSRQQKLLGNMDFVRNRKAEKLAKSKLKNAFKALQAKQVDVFYAELSAGLLGYAENKFAIDRADLTMDSLQSELEKLGMPDTLTAALRETLEKCEFARFAPSVDKTKDMNELYQTAKNLIVNVEDELQKIKSRVA